VQERRPKVGLSCHWFGSNKTSSLGGGGAEQQEALKKIKEYLMSPPVLRAPKAGNPFKMYIVAQEWVIGAVLLQEEDGK
jgi:hypothetical protein